MTKREAEKIWREEYLPLIKRHEASCAAGFRDEPMRAESWNNFTDDLRQCGEITLHQYNTWSHPR